MEQINLSGTWDFRLDHERHWRPIPVPGCWEALGVHKQYAGPAWYRTRFTIPAEWAGWRVWLRFGGVSYHCEISVNGRAIGEHTGLWDAFAVEVTDAAVPGEESEVLVRVEKPAGLERGPSSASLPGRFPLRETLAGFLPYVWGHVFGGIWQDVALVATGQVVFQDVSIRGAPDGRVVVEAALSDPGDVTLAIIDPDGRVVFEGNRPPTTDHRPPTTDDERGLAHRSSFIVHRFEATINNPRPWSPDRPALYIARLRIADRGQPRAP